ncbi:MAG: hypothetical protein ACT4NL_18650 [Pseudomarimonas sp.]
MRKPYVQFLLVTLAGVVAAVFSVMLGCTSPWQWFGVMCGHNFPFSVALIAGFFWFAFALIFYLRLGIKALR